MRLREAVERLLSKVGQLPRTDDELVMLTIPAGFLRDLIYALHPEGNN